MDFAGQLREAMAGMTQTDVAIKSGLRQGTISRYLRGERLPGLRQLEALEQALPRLRELRGMIAG